MYTWRNQTPATFRAMSISKKPIRVCKMAQRNLFWHDGFDAGIRRDVQAFTDAMYRRDTGEPEYQTWINGYRLAQR